MDIKKAFRNGDKIIMLEDCGGIKKGEIHKVETNDNGLFITGNINERCTGLGHWKLATKDWDSLQVDDVLVDSNGDKRYILAVCGRVIFLSYVDSKDISGLYRTKEELIKSGYTILQDEEEEIIELTLEEIADKFGVDVKLIKIKK